MRLRVWASAMLSAAELDKLAAILGLLSSDKAGEVAAAGAAATRFVSKRGLAWRDVLAPTVLCKTETHSPEADVLADWPRNWRDAVRACQAEPGLLSDWDARFLGNIAAYAHRPSGRQLEILRELVERVRAAVV